MENSQFEKDFCFSSNRHRHLKSKTYRTLVQILSHCYDHSQVCAPEEPISGAGERNELVRSDGAVPETSPVQRDTFVNERMEDVGQEGGLSDARMAIGELEHIMQIYDNENLDKQEDLLICGTSEGTGYKDTDLNRQQILMDELEDIVNGDDKIFRDHSMNSSATLMEKNGSDLVALTNKRDKHIGVQQIVIEESGSKTKPQMDIEKCALEFSKPYDTTVDIVMDHGDAKLIEDVEELSSLFRNNDMEVEHEMCHKEMQVKKSVHSNGTLASQNSTAENVEIEEGEISGDYEVDDMLFTEDVVSEEKKVDEKQVSKDSFDKRQLSCSEQTRVIKQLPTTSFSANVVDHTSRGGAMNLKETAKTETKCKSKKVFDGLIHANDADRKAIVGKGIGSSAAAFKGPAVTGKISVPSATGKQGMASDEKLDPGVSHKRKRSAPSKEKKAKKKHKDRKKRAEKNRELGVKRLKLRPVVQPKPVIYCRHYLNGRCHEGDECKFSHDTVPLTKSSPCCHFARDSCLKGDDCPFDHQLSKYPCNTFVAKGVCGRGDRCKFSHEIPLKEDVGSASGGSRPELEPQSLLHMSNSHKQPNTYKTSNQSVDFSFNSGKVLPSKNSAQNVATPPLKTPAVAPKGISCLFFGKSSVHEANKLNQGSSSSKSNDSGKVHNQSKPTVLGSVLRKNEAPPVVPSKGVNFLSFGNSSLDNSSSRTLASLLPDRVDGVKSSLLGNFTARKEASSSAGGETKAKIGDSTAHSLLNAIQKSNEAPKKMQLTVTPRGINFIAVGTNDSINNKQVTLPSSSGNGINNSNKESSTNTDNHQHSSTIPWRLPASPLASAQSSRHLAHGCHKSTQNSAQKALLSTLQFAARIESEMKINKSSIGSYL